MKFGVSERLKELGANVVNTESDNTVSLIENSYRSKSLHLTILENWQQPHCWKNWTDAQQWRLQQMELLEKLRWRYAAKAMNGQKVS